MYATGSDAQPVTATLAAVRGAPVLTVTDDATDPGRQGHHQFRHPG